MVAYADNAVSAQRGEREEEEGGRRETESVQEAFVLLSSISFNKSYVVDYPSLWEKQSPSPFAPSEQIHKSSQLQHRVLHKCNVCRGEQDKPAC